MVHALLRRGAPALAVALTAAVLGPGVWEAAGQDPGESDRAHAKVACAACHHGPAAGREVGTVPEASCTRSGCHADGGPKEVTVSTVTFAHRDHGEGAEVGVSCAGCHKHPSGEEGMGATLEACDVCHADELGGGEQGECLSCHQDPTHVPVTNQGVRIPHSELPGVEAPLPWVAEECVRCHYDVGRPSLDVPMARCSSCHDRLLEAASGGIGADLHPDHRGVNCTVCHEAGGHRVRAMSAAVEIRCAGCHPASHGLTADDAGDPARDGIATGVCTYCHRETHAAEQRLLLGIVPGVDMRPSFKFGAGLTCTSCHTSGRAADAGAERAAPDLVPCTSCHRAEYQQVLEWWREGSRQRFSRASDYVARGSRRLEGSATDSAARLLDRARRTLRGVAAGSPVHNLRAGDRTVRRVVEDVERAYRLSGVAPPPAPELGRPPRPGFCSYCHYSLDEPRPLNRMPLDFHQEVVGGG